MIRFTAVCASLLFWGVAAQASCYNYEESSTSAPTVLMCVEGRCGEIAATFECSNTSGAQFGFDNGLSIECSVQAGTACAIFLGDRRLSEQVVTCTSRTEADRGACKSLPSPCDAHMSDIRAGFEELPEYARMDAQSVLQALNYYMNFDTFPAKPARIDGAWGPRTEQAFRSFCANDLHSIWTQSPGLVTEQEAYNLTRSLNDLLEVMGDRGEM